MNTTTNRGIPVQLAANWFIEKAAASGCNDLSQMKLQKLVYYAHGWHLAFRDAPLIEQSFECWKFGPVCAELYSHCEDLGENIRYPLKIDDSLKIPASSASILNAVWNSYGKFSAFRLSDMTHSSNTPWSQLMEDNPGPMGFRMPIPNTLIKDHFVAKLRQQAANQSVSLA